MRKTDFIFSLVTGRLNKSIWMLMMLVWINMLPAYSQPGKNDPLVLSFNSGKAKLQHASFYDNPSLGISRNEAAKQLVNSFSEETYEAYQHYFQSGECHVDLTTFNQWRSRIGNAQPVIKAYFELSQGDQQYCFVKYTLQHDQLTFAFGQLYKKWNGKWYFCSFDENIQQGDLIMFFTLAQEDFFNAWKKDRSHLLQNTCFLQNGMVDGSKLINAYFDKYRSNDPCFDTLNLLFEDRIQAVENRNAEEITQMEQYFRKASLSPDEFDYLLRLVKSHNTHMALSYFSQLSGLHMQEIIEQLSKETTHE